MLPLFFLLFSSLATLVTSNKDPNLFLDEHIHLKFERFIKEHNKVYIDEEEKLFRFEIFKENVRKAYVLNEQSDHAIFGVTRFMDLTEDEFVEKYTGLGSPPTNLTYQACTTVSDDQVPDYNAPESFDWRQHNAVTRVKDQHRCGGCYAFSASGNIEGQYAIKHKILIELSEQQTVDCDMNSHGCQGGFMATAFRTMIQQGGIEKETDYPFVGRKQFCQFTPGKAAVRLTDCYSYNIASQEKLKQLVYGVGPISVGLKATNFHTYTTGVMKDEVCSYGPINHAVLVVGYGTDNGVPYWLIKNSWGVSFGDQGYIKIQRGEGTTSCGMMNNSFMASSVVM